MRVQLCEHTDCIRYFKYVNCTRLSIIISIKLWSQLGFTWSWYNLTSHIQKHGAALETPLPNSCTLQPFSLSPILDRRIQTMGNNFGKCPVPQHENFLIPLDAKNTHNCSSNGQGINLTMQCPWDQANQEPSGEKATLQVSQLDFQSNWWGRPGLSSANSSGSSGAGESMLQKPPPQPWPGDSGKGKSTPDYENVIDFPVGVVI